MNSRINASLANQIKGQEREDESLVTPKFFDFRNVERYWSALSNQDKEKILIIKDDSIIENLSQSLNNLNFIITSNGDATQAGLVKQTYLFSRSDKAPLVLSILEFDSLARSFTDFNYKSYMDSIVIILVETIDKQEDGSTKKILDHYPKIDEDKVHALVHNIDLLEKQRAVLKIKSTKLDSILHTFQNIFNGFCDGEKIITAKKQYKKLFSSLSTGMMYQLNPGKYNRKDVVSKLLLDLISVALLFENSMLKSYNKENITNNGNLDVNDAISVSQQQQYSQGNTLSQNNNISFDNLSTYFRDAGWKGSEEEKGDKFKYVDEIERSAPQRRIRKASQNNQYYQFMPGVYIGNLTIKFFQPHYEENEYTGNFAGYGGGAYRKRSDEPRANYYYQGKAKRGYSYHVESHVVDGYNQFLNAAQHGQSQGVKQQQEPTSDPLQNLLGSSNPFVLLSKKTQNGVAPHLSPSPNLNNGMHSPPLLDTVLGIGSLTPNGLNQQSTFNLPKGPLSYNGGLNSNTSPQSEKQGSNGRKVSEAENTESSIQKKEEVDVVNAINAESTSGKLSEDHHSEDSHQSQKSYHSQRSYQSQNYQPRPYNQNGNGKKKLRFNNNAGDFHGNGQYQKQYDNNSLQPGQLLGYVDNQRQSPESNRQQAEFDPGSYSKELFPSLGDAHRKGSLKSKM